MDWKQIIAEIQESGLSQPQIAERCKCAQATISDLSRGKTEDPRDSIGQALRELLARVRAERAAAKSKPTKRKNPDRDNSHKERG